jgi:hypothetical protein
VSGFEQRDREERERLEKIIDRLIDLLFQNSKKIAATARGELMPASIAVGGNGATFKFTELAADGVTIVPASGPITFASDTPAVAVIGNAPPVVNPDGSVSVQVVAVAAGKAVISGINPASANKVAAADSLTVTAAAAVATSATGVLTAN